jgi:hypothetical protein
VDEDMKAFQVAFATLRDYFKCMEGVYKEQRTERANGMRREGYRLANLKKEFGDHGCGDTLAGCFGNLMHIRGESNDLVLVLPDGVTVGFDPDEFEPLKCPVVFSDTRDTFSAELQRTYKALKDAVLTKTRKYKATLQERNSGFVALGLPVADVGADAMLKTSLAPSPLTDMEVWPQLVVAQDFLYQWSKSSYPLQGCSCVVMPMHGYLAVMLVPLSVVLDIDKGMDNITELIEAEGTKKKADQGFQPSAFPMVGLPAGKMLFCPFGYIPLCITTPNPAEEGSSTYVNEYGSYVLLYVGAKPPSTTDVIVLTETHAAMSKGLHQVKSLKSCIPSLKGFLESWDPSKASPKLQATDATSAENPQGGGV